MPARALLILAAALVAQPAAAQPEWLPRPTRRAAQPVEPDDPCADPLRAAFAPAVRESGFDRDARACLAGSFTARARAAAVLDGPELYQTAVASAEIELHWLYLNDLELTAGAHAIEDRDARDEGGDEGARFGPVYLAASAGRAARAFNRPLRLAWSLRFDLPWTRDDTAEQPVAAASPRVAAALGLGPRLAGHAQLGALLWLAHPPGGIETRRALALSADLAWTPLRWLGAGLGAAAQTGWYGGGLDHILARGGLRAGLGSRARLELAGAARLAGDEPTDLLLELSLAFDR